MLMATGSATLNVNCNLKYKLGLTAKCLTKFGMSILLRDELVVRLVFSSLFASQFAWPIFRMCKTALKKKKVFSAVLE